MNDQEILKLKIELEARKKDLEEKIKKLSVPADFGNDNEGNEDMSEEADEAEQEGADIAVAQAFKKELADVNSGLDKIAKGVYGQCDSCDHCDHCH